MIYPSYIKSGRDLIVIVVSNQDFFSFAWKTFNLKTLNKKYDIHFFETNNEVNWKKQVLFLIDEIKYKYDSITVIGPNTFFKLNDNQNICSISEKILNTLEDEKKKIAACLLLDENILYEYVYKKENHYEFDIFHTFYNLNFINYTYFDFAVFNTFRMRYYPPIKDFYLDHIHDKHEDLFFNTMFNNQNYDIISLINKKLTFRPFYKQNYSDTLNTIRSSKEAKVFTFKENFNPFLNEIEIDNFAFQHSYMYNLISKDKDIDNELCKENLSNLKRVKLISELV